MSAASRLHMIPGGGDVLAALEAAAEQVRSGDLVGVVICGITDNDGGTCGWTWAHKDEIGHAWARLVAVTSLAHHEMTIEGLDAE